MLCADLACTTANCITLSLGEAPCTSNPHCMPMSLHLDAYVVKSSSVPACRLSRVKVFGRSQPARLGELHHRRRVRHPDPDREPLEGSGFIGGGTGRNLTRGLSPRYAQILFSSSRFLLTWTRIGFIILNIHGARGNHFM